MVRDASLAQPTTSFYGCATLHSRRTLELTLLIVLFVVGLPFIVSSHEFDAADGNDTPGRLDLTAVAVRHAKSTLIFELTTADPWSVGSLGKRSFFLIGFDTDDDRVPEICAYAFGPKKLRAVVTDCGSRFIAQVPATKLSGRKLSIKVPTSMTSRSATYLSHRWAALSVWYDGRRCDDGCVDSIPNRYPLFFHDLDAPIIRTPTRVGDYARIDEATLGATVRFAIRNQRDGVRLDNWKLQQRVLQQDERWKTVASGSRFGTYERQVIGPDGSVLELRVAAVDTAGNIARGESVSLPLPYDDTSTAVGFPGEGGAGAWTTTTGGGYILDSALASSTAGAVFEIPMVDGHDYGSTLIVHGGPGEGKAKLYTNGLLRGTLVETSETRAGQKVFEIELGVALYTISIEVRQGTFTVDAIRVVPRPRPY